MARDDAARGMSRRSYLIGIDDAPFPPGHRGDVPTVGAIFNGARLEGVLIDKVRRDGANATTRLAGMICKSRFASSLQVVLLQGITVAGFNVVDLPQLNARTGLPVIAVSRHRPDRDRIRRALLKTVPGGRRKWRIIERLEPAEKCGPLYLHSAGMPLPEAAALVERFATNSHVPEPLRTAHLIAGALAHGESRHRA